MSKHNDEFEQEDFEFELPEPTGTAFSSRRQEGVCCDHKWVRVPLMNDKQRCSRCNCGHRLSGSSERYSSAMLRCRSVGRQNQLSLRMS